MKFLPYLLKHLRRNWIRTLSTIPGRLLVCVTDGDGQCRYIGQLPRTSRPSLDEALEEIRAQHRALLLDA